MFLKETKTPQTKTPESKAPEPKTPATHSMRKALEEGTAARPAGIPSIISPDLKIVGNLKSTGDIQIDGTVEGDIDSRSVVVGDGAKVEGAIIAETVRVSGAVNGQVKAKSVTLDRSAEVLGDIVHETLTMEAGAFLEGSVRRMAASGENPDKVAPLRPAQAGNGHEPKLGEIQSTSA